MIVPIEIYPLLVKRQHFGNQVINFGNPVSLLGNIGGRYRCEYGKMRFNKHCFMMSSVTFTNPQQSYRGLSDGIEAWCQFVGNAKDSRERRNPKTASSGHTIHCGRIGDTL